jgi:hypothetical protein
MVNVIPNKRDLPIASDATKRPARMFSFLSLGDGDEDNPETQ